MREFEHLFEPLTIGTKTLRNRIVMPPHGVSFLPGYGQPADRIVDYHVERAKGGAGLVIMTNFVMPRSWQELGSWGGNLKTTPIGALDLATDPSLIGMYKKLTEGIHEHGGVFVSQLNAGGRQYFAPGILSFNLPLWACSAIPDVRLRQIPKAMEIEDIQEMVEAYAIAAVNLHEAGADGVEVFAAQGYLLSEFLSPSSNRRNDHYGGSIENRMRFLVEVVEAIRRAVGSDFLIGVRLNGDDFAPNGFTIEDAKVVASRLGSRGIVDYLNISGKTHYGYPGWIADMTVAEAQFADQAAEIKDTVGALPVCVASRIGTPQLAEQVLSLKKADLVGMARALISDPELPNKAARGDLDDIRLCTFSNQSCIMGLQTGRGVGCTHNTAVGREAQLGIGKMRPVAHAKRVVVVGGGPAGMAAARIACERGHDVLLFEKQSRLGGQNLMTATMPSRQGFAEVTRWQEHRLRRQGVEIMLDHEVTVEDLLSERADAVVVATGSVPRRDCYTGFRPDVSSIPGLDGDDVHSLWDVFHSPGSIKEDVVLVDDDTHLSAVYVAEYLAEMERRVTLVTPQMYAARDLSINFASELYRRLKVKGVVILTNTLVTALDGTTVHLVDVQTQESSKVETQSVVLGTGNKSEDSLYYALKPIVAELHRIGDCVAPRRLDEAILDGERVGWML